MSIKRGQPYLLALAATLALTAAGGYAQSAGQHEHGTVPTTPAAQSAPADHQAMMMANMQAEQQKLDELVVQMNAATGPDKVDRIAAVVTELAAMHKRMTGMMMMHGDMTQAHH